MKKPLLLFFLMISSVAFSAPYLMTSDADCGPASLHAVTDIPEAQIEAQMGWNPNFPDITDGAEIHFKWLKSQKITYQELTMTQVVTANYAIPGKTVILIHSNNDPRSILGMLHLQSTFEQHWVVLAGCDGKNISLYWGDGTIKTFSCADFMLLMTQGGPTNTAYEITPTGTSKPKKWWLLFAAVIIKLFK
jgi:hypothetical protein